VSWREFREHFTTDTTWQWKRLLYFYENLDVDKYDYWFYRHFHDYEDRMMGFWKNSFQFMASYGRDVRRTDRSLVTRVTSSRRRTRLSSRFRR